MTVSQPRPGVRRRQRSARPKGRWGGASGASSPGRTPSSAASSRAIADSRVDYLVGDVDEDAGEDERGRAEERYRHDHVVVAAADRLERQPADARYAGQRLDEERALQQPDHGEGDERAQRQEGVAQDVARHHRRLAPALGARRPHVVLPQHAQREGARVARPGRHRRQRQRDDGDHYLAAHSNHRDGEVDRDEEAPGDWYLIVSVSNANSLVAFAQEADCYGAVARPAARRQPAQLQREGEEEERHEDQPRYRLDEEEGADGGRVGPRPLTPRREDAERYPQPERDDQRDAIQLEGAPDGREDDEGDDEEDQRHPQQAPQ